MHYKFCDSKQGYTFHTIIYICSQYYETFLIKNYNSFTNNIYHIIKLCHEHK